MNFLPLYNCSDLFTVCMYVCIGQYNFSEISHHNAKTVSVEPAYSQCYIKSSLQDLGLQCKYKIIQVRNVCGHSSLQWWYTQPHKMICCFDLRPEKQALSLYAYKVLTGPSCVVFFVSLRIAWLRLHLFWAGLI